MQDDNRVYITACISRPNKHSVTSNEDDVLTVENVAIIPDDVMAEGERDKVIQNPVNNVEQKDQQNTQDVSNLEPEADKPESPPDYQSPNSVPFPSAPDLLTVLKFQKIRLSESLTETPTIL